ncbi:MAG: glycosyltransferase [Candidatus Binataceae bacterium]
MDISVIIPTFNRAEGLRNTLRALTLQTYPRFEVIVVNGPSTDHTMEVLAEYNGRLRTANNPKLNLALSRNIGLSKASGEIVAFIDDDAIPYPGWLMELAAAYDGDHVGGAGGVVFDAGGFSLQYRFSVCNRTGEPRHDVSEPLERYQRSGADPFLYLQGTNMSFRRRCLIEIGGFDEEFHYYYDDVDLSVRMIDRGYMLKAIDHAAVLHKYLPSYVRSPQGIIRDPFVAVKNRYYFALQSARTPVQHALVLIALRRYCDDERRRARSYFEDRLIDRAQLNYCLKRIDEGVTTGLARARAKRRLRHEFPPRAPADFVPFAPDRPRDDRLSICFLSRELPPSEPGGVGPYPEDLAREAARQGHEVHIITRASKQSEVDFKDGVWLHRLSDLDPWPPELLSVPLNHNLMHLWGVYQEVCRIQELSAVDVVVAPLWLCEGALCALDPRFATILSLTTEMKNFSELHPPSKDNLQLPDLVGLETETFRSARYIYAISQDVLDRYIECYGPTLARTFVLPLDGPLAIFTERLLEEYQQIVRQHRSCQQVTGGHSLVKTLSVLLVKAAHIKPRLAYRVAKALLTKKREEVQRSGALHRLWQAPDEDFVTGLYRYILGREPDIAGHRKHLKDLRSGVDRLALLDAFLESEEFLKY